VRWAGFLTTGQETSGADRSLRHSIRRASPAGACLRCATIGAARQRIDAASEERSPSALASHLRVRLAWRQHDDHRGGGYLHSAPPLCLRRRNDHDTSWRADWAPWIREPCSCLNRDGKPFAMGWAAPTSDARWP